MATISFESTNVSTTPGFPTHTFTAAGIGTAASDRIVAVALAYDGSVTARATAVTIGGITATQAVEEIADGDFASEIWYAAVPTGTTADIVVTFGSAIAKIAYAAYKITAADETPHDTDISVDVDPAVLNAFAVPSNGVAVFALTSNEAGGVAWTNAIENVDTAFGTDGYSFAHSITPGSLIITADNGESATSLVGASWGLVGAAASTYVPIGKYETRHIRTTKGY